MLCCANLLPFRYLNEPMNEKVLEVIIKLLAIVANIDDSAGDKRGIIEKFLRSHVNPFEVRKSLYLFDEYTAFANDAGLREAFDLASGLNKDLSVKQKLVILVHLMEMVLADQEITEIEESFIKTVSQALNIPDNARRDISQFLQQNDATELDSENILLINDQERDELYKVRHRYHAELDTSLAILRLPSSEMYFLRLMLPTKEVFLNGEQLNWEYVYPLAVGSTIRGTNIEPIFYSEVVSCFLRPSDEAKVAFEAKDIQYLFKGRKMGLQEVNIAEESGQIIALMGASGSGKSTLLNVMNGNLPPQKGTIKINGIDVYRYKEEIKGVIGYVPQDDLLIEDLTVYQNLFYAAKLCFGEAEDDKLEKLVNKTLNSLGLFEAKDLRVGNALDKTISGGQRKRLNIGLELLRQPAILFVDEPTSGLSSRDSENIIDLLRGLSLMGKLVFVVIHQPSSDIFKMFDKLLILDVGGYQIYYGNPMEALAYFRTQVNHIDRDEESACPVCGNVNVEEIFKIIESRVLDEYGNETNQRKITPEMWYEAFKKKTKLPKVEKVLTYPPQSLDIPTRWKQAFIFMTRDLLAKLRNKQYMAINLLEAPLLAFILAFIVRYYPVGAGTEEVGYMFSQNKNLPSYIFMSVIVAIFMGLTISAEEIIKDAKILKREAFLELSRASYLVSKIAILFGFSAVQTLSYTLVGNAILSIKGMTLEYWLVFFSSACLANVLGLNISAAFKSVITIYILIPILLIPQLVLGGIVVRYDDINPMLGSRDGSVPLIAEIICSRWSFEALMVTQFKDNEFEQPFYAYNRQIAQTSFKRDYYLPKLQSKLNEAYRLMADYEQEQAYNSAVALLQHEFRKQSEQLPEYTFPMLDRLAPTTFNRASYETGKSWLNTLDSLYLIKQKVAVARKDRLIKKMGATPEGKQAYQQRIRDYRNESVVKILTNTNTADRIVEYKDRFVQKMYPIYLYPPEGKYELAFNAHFYAPYKFLFDGFVPTFWYNIMMIWIGTLILYTTLYFNVLKSFVDSFEFLGRKREKRQ